MTWLVIRESRSQIGLGVGPTPRGVRVWPPHRSEYGDRCEQAYQDTDRGPAVTTDPARVCLEVPDGCLRMSGAHGFGPFGFNASHESQMRGRDTVREQFLPAQEVACGVSDEDESRPSGSTDASAHRSPDWVRA